MRFLVDECAGPGVASWLEQNSHDAFSVYNQARGITDDEVIKRSFAEQRILITADKDFGAKIFRDRVSHAGVILLRLKNESKENKIDALRRLLGSYSERLADNYVVVSENRVRISTNR